MAHLAAARRRGAAESSRARLRERGSLLRGREALLAPVIVLSALAVWEVLARAGLLPAFFFPAPSIIAGTLVKLLVEGGLVTDLAATLRRLVLGCLLGAVPAVVLGFGMGLCRGLRAAVDPLIASAHPIPKIAILPLVMIIFGMGEASKIILIGLGVFFPLLINTVVGVSQISPIYFEVADNYGAPPFKIFTRVLLPGCLPMVLAGVRLGVNVALLLTIALEMVTARDGLGASIWMAWETFRTEQIYATLVVIALLGVSFSLVLRSLASRFVPWQMERRA